jgi:hypothetical protein
MSNAWARGADWWPIRKLRTGKWIIESTGCYELLGRIPVLFKTRREAREFFNNLCLIRFRQWRGLDSYPDPDYDIQRGMKANKEMEANEPSREVVRSLAPNSD